MSRPYVRTDTILDKILAQKVEETAALKQRLSEAHLRRKVEVSADAERAPRDFAAALRRETVALIAEVKKASPSKGVLVADFDPLRIARTYSENGAAAVSVLTDERFFQGQIGYLAAVRAEVPLPVLRKDFLIDEYQIYYSRAMLADAVLLIVAALDDAQLRDLHSLSQELGMAALVEVHDEAELDRALKIGASLIGVNNRNLHTFEVDLETTALLAQRTPPDVLLVAESGISSADDVRHMGELGAHAVLVGEGLVTAPDMGGMVRAFSQQRRRQA